MTPLEIVRRRALLTQRELAQKAGVALSTVYLIENGRQTNPRFRVIRAISDVLGVSPLDIDEFRSPVEAEFAATDRDFPGIKFAALFWIDRVIERIGNPISRADFHRRFRSIIPDREERDDVLGWLLDDGLLVEHQGNLALTPAGREYLRPRDESDV